jgi:hypothetical protein
MVLAGALATLGNSRVVVFDTTIANNNSMQQGDQNGLGGGAIVALGQSVVHLTVAPGCRATELLGCQVVPLQSVSMQALLRRLASGARLSITPLWPTSHLPSCRLGQMGLQ